MSTVTIDNVEHNIDNLGKEEKAIVMAINKCDLEIEHYNHLLAIVSTARQAYVNDLGQRLNKEEFS